VIFYGVMVCVLLKTGGLGVVFVLCQLTSPCGPSCRFIFFWLGMVLVLFFFGATLFIFLWFLDKCVMGFWF